MASTSVIFRCACRFPEVSETLHTREQYIPGHAGQVRRPELLPESEEEEEEPRNHRQQPLSQHTQG